MNLIEFICAADIMISLININSSFKKSAISVAISAVISVVISAAILNTHLSEIPNYQGFSRDSLLSECCLKAIPAYIRVVTIYSNNNTHVAAIQF